MAGRNLKWGLNLREGLAGEPTVGGETCGCLYDRCWHKGRECPNVADIRVGDVLLCWRCFNILHGKGII
jgi:hypothetical protein